VGPTPADATQELADAARNILGASASYETDDVNEDRL
jgi:hypothetical protein